MQGVRGSNPLRSTLIEKSRPAGRLFCVTDASPSPASWEQVTGTDARPLLGRRWVILSPFAIILLGRIVARLWSEAFPGTAWIALALVCWIAIGVVTVLGATRQRRRSWWAPSARVPWWVVPVALLFNLSVLVFVNAHVLPALR